MASNIQKIIKIAANNAFNNDTVNNLITQINDVSNNLSDLCGNFVSPNKFVLHDLSANDISCVSLTVNGIPITMNGGGGSASNITSINELTDVSVNNINNGQTISWNAVEGYFQAANFSENEITSINQLSDISVNGINDGEVMAWNATGGYFEPSDAPIGEIPTDLSCASLLVNGVSITKNGDYNDSRLDTLDISMNQVILNIANITGGAQEHLDTLAELGAALDNSANLASNMRAQFTAVNNSLTTNTSNISTNTSNISTNTTKLNGIASGAEVNVQSDWNASSGDAFILNKPTIPSGNQIIDWTQDQGATNIDANNYVNTTYSVGDGGLTQNNFTNALKTKLDGISSSANNYSLPTASSTVLGGIKVGSNLSIDGNGVLSASGGGTTINTINDISDVDITGVQEGHVLKWNNTLSKFEAKNLATTTTSTTPQKGQLLETVAGVCDGRSITVESGTYTLPNITTGYDPPSGWQDLPGSEINYKPPIGTKQVIYNFIVMVGRKDAGNITTFKFVIDGVDVFSEFALGRNALYGAFEHLKLTININGSDDAANANFSSWNSNKTIKIMIHEYSDTLEAFFHKSRYNINTHDDTLTSYVVKPQIIIKAIGESQGQTVTLSQSSISDLSDVSFNTLTNGDLLIWDSTNNYFKAEAPQNAGKWSGSGDIYYTGGKVGVGTTSPYRHLHIHENSNNPVYLRLSNNESASSGETNVAGFDIALDGDNVSFINRDGGWFGFDTPSSGGRRMTILGDGNVGIGTDSPDYDLDVTGDINFTGTLYQNGSAFSSGSSKWSGSTDIYYTSGDVGIGTTSPTFKLDVRGGMRLGDGTTTEQDINIVSKNGNWQIGTNNSGNGTDSNQFYIYDTAYRFSVQKGTGNVGIGTTSPVCPLDVKGEIYQYISSRAYFNSSATTGAGSGHSGDTVTIKAQADIWTGGALLVTSDRRIKENIIEVDDNSALKKVRDISCCWYNYKDNVLRVNGRVLGFIAQQVNEHLPEAVSIQTGYIPNEMKNLEDISWNGVEMSSETLSDVSGVKYRFYVSNDINGNDEVIKEIAGNIDNTFTFDKYWNNVFCYGKKVDDFHTLDKQKLFALNFSATQELDRKVIALEEENQTLKERLEALEKRLSDAGI